MGTKRKISSDNAVCAACGYRAATASFAFCPGCGNSFVPAKSTPTRRRIGWFSMPAMLYPKSYKWFVLFSAADIVLTWFILQLGGTELNVIADSVLATGGLRAIVIYKFSLAVAVVLICEVVGRRRPRKGRNLALAAVAIAALPVGLSIAQLVMP